MSISVIDKINNSFKNYFNNPTYCFRSSSKSKFVLSGNYLSAALNNYPNGQEAVKVIKWFDDFWLYIEINFIRFEIETNLREGINKKDYFKKLSEDLLVISKNYYETTMTLSVFKGVDSDKIKCQLFRAEWDNLLGSNNAIHPQPHWHIYSNLTLEKSFKTLVEKSKNGFAELIDEEDSKGIDLKRIHFAMNGNWDISGSHIHKICNEKAIISWFQGLLGHIKEQLDYVK
jgi:hypothetical protein